MTVDRPAPRLRLVDAASLAAALPMAAAIDALERGFREQDTETAPLRSVAETPAGTLLTMPAAGEGGVGVKLVTLTPANPERGIPFLHAAYVLFDPETQAPEAVIDGGTLTALRTAAVSGLATRHLARPDAHRLVVFGAGCRRSRTSRRCARSAGSARWSSCRGRLSEPRPWWLGPGGRDSMHARAFPTTSQTLISCARARPRPGRCSTGHGCRRARM